MPDISKSPISFGKKTGGKSPKIVVEKPGPLKKMNTFVDVVDQAQYYRR